MQSGQHCFLSGPSGSGKSTLLAILGGILPPTSGTVHFSGRDLTALSARQRDRWRGDHIGFIFQQFNLIPYLSPRSNIELSCAFSLRRQQRALERSPTLAAEAERLLERLHMPRETWSRAASRLSVGQQQRVAAARALIGGPELIIADEPTSALDASLQQSFIDLLLEECSRAGSTLLFVSHDLRLASRFGRHEQLATLPMGKDEGA